MQDLSSQIYKEESRQCCQRLEEGEMGSSYLIDTEFQSYRMKKVLWMDGGDDSQQRECT